MSAMYLAAIVVANLVVARFGPGASVLTAFVLIGLVITTRDRLHEAWHGNGLRWKMAGLIAAGGALSYLLNADAGRIALALFVAFSVSETVDAVLYHWLRSRGWYLKVNGSNAAAGAIDSVLFPTLAFGVFLPWVVLGQFAAKVFGGAIWSWLLRPRHLAAALLLVVPGVLHAQIVAFGAGSVTSDAGTQVVVEEYIAAPALTEIKLRPFGIVSVPVADVGSPTFVTAIDAPLLSGDWGWSALGTGVVWLPFLDYKPEPMVTSTTGLRLHWPGWSAVLVASTRFESRAWSVVVKLNYTAAFGG